MANAVEARKKWVTALVAFLTAFGLFAATAVEKAGATEVLPADEQLTANNITPTDFIPTNASNPVGLRCDTARADFTVSSTISRNENNPGVGTFSVGSGSVITNMDANGESPSVRAPVFDDCDVWNFATGMPATGAVVTTNENNGAWTVAADAIPGMTNGDGILAIGVPKSGALVDIDAFPCQVNVSFDQASSVIGKYTNGTETTAGELAVDGQIDFSSNCPVPPFGLTPAQFEGSFAVTSASGDPVTID